MSILTPKDPTFRNYAPEAAKAYAKGRSSGYPGELFEAVVEHHREAGGEFGRVLDVGCGPGNATRDIAVYFEEAVGVDPSVEMINVAREAFADEGGEGGVRFEVSAAEECDKVAGLEEGSVDLITSAMAVRLLVGFTSRRIGTHVL
jgi:trans-aconitate 3-methyltransferase